jgi:hypothetical protein
MATVRKVVTQDILESVLKTILNEKVLKDSISATNNATSATTAANTATTNANTATANAKTATDAANKALEAFAADKDADSLAVQDVTNKIEYHFSIRLVDGKPVGVITS